MKKYFQKFKKKWMFMPVILVILAIIVLIFTFAVPWDVRIVDEEIALAQITTLTFADLTEYVDLSDTENLRLDLEDSPNPLGIYITAEQSEYTDDWTAVIRIRERLSQMETYLISTIVLPFQPNTLIIECTNHGLGDYIHVEDSFMPIFQNVTFYLKGGDDNIIVGNGNFVRIVAGDGDDRININRSQTNNVRGGNGNDFIATRNTYVRSLIYGGNGNDRLTSDGVYDTTIHRLYGDAGDDEISLGFPYSGVTTSGRYANLYGGSGNDRLNGTVIHENFYGGDGNDTINGGGGNDRCNGGRGNDVIRGEDGDDEINCGDGNDFGFGGNGNDVMRGNNGNDTLMGEDGNDEIYGDDGNDHLIGGPGEDKLYGGLGRDRLFSDREDSEVVE